MALTWAPRLTSKSRHSARDTGKEHDLLKAISRAVEGHANNLFRAGEWHTELLRLEPKIIITTNYDRILERATNHGFNVHSYGSTTFGTDVRRGSPVLLKIHGTVDDIDNIVLTQRDYTRLRVRGGHAFEVLRALFMTRVALFVGYSLRDPDIRLLLENALGGREQVPAHYLLVDGGIPDYEAEVLRYSFGVMPIKYPSGRREVALEMLRSLAELVENSPRS